MSGPEAQLAALPVAGVRGPADLRGDGGGVVRAAANPGAGGVAAPRIPSAPAAVPQSPARSDVCGAVRHQVRAALPLPHARPGNEQRPHARPQFVLTRIPGKGTTHPLSARQFPRSPACPLAAYFWILAGI